MIKELVSRELLLSMITQSIDDPFYINPLNVCLIERNKATSLLEVALYLPLSIGLAIHKVNISFINLNTLDWLFTNQGFQIIIRRELKPHKIIFIEEYDKRLLELIEHRRSI